MRDIRIMKHDELLQDLQEKIDAVKFHPLVARVEVWTHDDLERMRAWAESESSEIPKLETE